MNAPTTPPLPASLLRAEAEEHDLDARILQVEQRLIAREENLRRRVSHVSTRVREAWRPRRLLLPLAGAGIALAALIWFGRGRPAVRPAQAPGSAPPPESHGHGSHWISLLGLVWPLLPPNWRARVPPSVVNLVMTVGLPLLETLLQRRPAAPLLTAGPLDPALLAGAWYEIVRLPARRHDGQPQWQHTFDASGALQMQENGSTAEGARHTRSAVATVLPDSGCARWRVSDWPALLQLLPLAWHELAVLHIDENELLLGSPGRDRLRLLSRSPELEPGRLQLLLALVRERGFELEQLQFVDRP